MDITIQDANTFSKRFLTKFLENGFGALPKRELEVYLLYLLLEDGQFKNETGGCHYDEECASYQKQCGACPVLGSDKDKDLNRKVWLRKQACFARLPNMTIVGLSKWLADCAASSSLFKSNPVVNLPNPIDTQTFAPFEQAEALKLFNLRKIKS